MKPANSLHSMRLILITVVAISAAAHHATAQPCPPTWDTAIGNPGFNDYVLTLEAFDDGTGPALYAGGKFTVSGNQPIDHIAKWDGHSWSQVGEGLPGTVMTLAVWDDGNGPALYAGGFFDLPDGSNLARWDGTHWTAVGGGTDRNVSVLASFENYGNGDLYVGGNFLSVGDGLEAYRIARWDGSQWHTVGSGFGPYGSIFADVMALEVYDDGNGPNLYAGGFFTYADWQPADFIARWDGTSWNALPIQFGPDHDMCIDHVDSLRAVEEEGMPYLYIGGEFRLDQPQAELIMKWDGQQTYVVGNGADFNSICTGIYDMVTFDDTTGTSLYIAG